MLIVRAIICLARVFMHAFVERRLYVSPQLLVKTTALHEERRRSHGMSGYANIIKQLAATKLQRAPVIVADLHSAAVATRRSVRRHLKPRCTSTRVFTRSSTRIGIRTSASGVRCEDTMAVVVLYQ